VIEFGTCLEGRGVASQGDGRSSHATGGSGGQGKRGLAQHTVANNPGGDGAGSSEANPQAAPTQTDPVSGAANTVATLTAVDGDLKGEAFVLVAGENHLGRGVDCAPVLNSRWISRSHAHITCADGRMMIRANEGKELFVNDVATTEQAVNDGDLIRMGTTVLILRALTSAESTMSSVRPVAPGSSGEHRASVSAPAARSGDLLVPPPERRKKSWWRFWVKPTPSLLFVRGARAGERIELTSARVRIGGLQDNEIVISGNDASRNHAELRVRDGRAHIWDLRSVNGTWVNEERIENRELRFGDVIRIGSAELRFED